MIVDNGKFYIYRHVRVDTNEPFYIGFGTKQKRDINPACYKRATDRTRGRCMEWYYIVTATGYEIDILCESNNEQFMRGKEKEFIDLYGDLLVNKFKTKNRYKR